ncbi:hypothetical protein ABPG75_000818 [Micractinium tetrahymenae]
MGQCCSAPREAADLEREASLAQAGLADRVLHPPIQGLGGLQLAVSQARLSAAAGGDAMCTQALVRSTPRGLFIALFEGQGKDRHAVPAFCRNRVLELFHECSVCNPDSPLEALKQTLERLDAAIFAAPSLKHATKVNSGASAVLLLVELGSQRCYCANVGAAGCLLSRITGSFNAKTPEGFFLTREHTTRNREELVRLQRRAPGEATPPAPAGSGGGEAGQTGEPTRALGFMEAKRQAGGSGALICEAFATDHGLAGTDQHLVLASSAFFELVGPTDCALRAHFHEKFARQELERAAAIAAAAAAAGLQDAPSPALLQAANTAEHLVYWALEKAARKLGRLQGRQHSSSGSAVSPLSLADVLALPLEVAPVAVPPASRSAEAAAWQAGRQGDDGSGVAQEEQTEEQQQCQLIRRDVVGDLGVIVVTLRRQDQSMDGGMRGVLMAARTAAAAQQAVAQAAGSGYVERLARRRWAQIRMLVDFYKAHRRVLLRQWWEAQDALLRRSRVSGASAGRINLLASLSNSPAKLASAAAAKANGGTSKRPGSGKAGGAAGGGSMIKAARAGPAARE